MKSPPAERAKGWDVEDLVSKGPDHLLGVDRADAPDHSRAEIFLDTVD